MINDRKKFETNVKTLEVGDLAADVTSHYISDSKLQVFSDQKKIGSAADNRNLQNEPNVNDEFRYIFHHIPRCGGTTIREILSQWFNCSLDYRPPWAQGKLLDEYRTHPFDLKNLMPGSVLCGHYEVEGTFIDQRYPGIFAQPNCRVFTFIRDPLEIAISMYYFERKNGLSLQISLEESVAARDDVLKSLLQRKIENYHKLYNCYFFIGIFEELQKSIDLLATLLNKPRIELPRMNMAERDNQQLPDSVKQDFKERNALGYKIYESCKALFRFRYSSCGSKLR